MRKFLWVALAILVSSVPAWGQGTGFNGTVVRATATIPGASIRVCTDVATGTPCSPLATIYSVADLSVPIAGSIITADAAGNYKYYAAAGCYQEQISAAGFSTKTQPVCSFNPKGAVNLSGGVTISTLPYTTTSPGTHSGTETFTGAATTTKLNNVLWVDGVTYSFCSQAAAAAGTVNKTIIMIPSNAALSDCGTVSENITVINYNGAQDQCNTLITATPPCSAINFNNDDGVVYAAERHEMTTAHQDANGVSLGLYSITTLKNATANGASGIDGISGEANTAGTLTGTFNALQAHEADVTVRSTGGTVSNAVAGVFYYNSDVGSTTAVTNAFGIRALGCNTVLGAVPTNCYGAFFARQDAGGVGKASARNYSFASEGPGLIQYNGGLGASFLDWEDSAHVTKHAIYGDSGNNFNIQAINAAGISFLDVGGTTRAILTSAGLKVATAFTPTTAAGIGLGTNALPFSNICLGTAATNNICTNVAAMAAARTLIVNDPLGTVALSYVIASGTSTLTANAALAAVTSQAAITTAGTGILTTDAIEWSYATAPTAGDSLCHVSPYVTAGNVNFVRTNPTAAAQNVSAIVINWRVIR